MAIGPNAKVENTTTGAVINLPPVAEIKWGPLKATGTTTNATMILGARLYDANNPFFGVPGAIPLGGDGTGGTWQVDFSTNAGNVGCGQTLHLFCMNPLDDKPWTIHIVDQPGACMNHVTQEIAVPRVGVEPLDALTSHPTFADPVLIFPPEGASVPRSAFYALAAIAPSTVPLHAFAMPVIIDQLIPIPTTYKLDFSVSPIPGQKIGTIGIFNLYKFTVPLGVTFCAIRLIRFGTPNKVYQSDIQKPYSLW